MDQKLTYTVLETAKLLGVGKNSVYEGVANGTIPAIRFGGRWIIPKFALHRWLEGDYKSSEETWG